MRNGAKKGRMNAYQREVQLYGLQNASLGVLCYCSSAIGPIVTPARVATLFNADLSIFLIWASNSDRNRMHLEHVLASGFKGLFHGGAEGAREDF